MLAPLNYLVVWHLVVGCGIKAQIIGASLIEIIIKPLKHYSNSQIYYKKNLSFPRGNPENLCNPDNNGYTACSRVGANARTPLLNTLPSP